MSSQRYFIKLAWNGAAYHGWQRQDNAISIQQVLEDALNTIFNSKISLTGAGRTDTGVHAREFYAHFDLDARMDAQGLNDKVYKLNSFLPADIVILKIFPVGPETHARFDALSRTYEYVITTRKDPFLSEFAWYVPGNPDVDKMNMGAAILMEYIDFTSFSKLHTQVKTNNCRLMYVRWETREHLLVLTIRADRFLRNMVRAIVGTLVDLGKDRITEDDLRNIVEARNRSKAGLSVPAHGLFLTAVEYTDDLLRSGE